MAIVHLRLQCKWSLCLGRQVKLIADKGGASRLDGVVVSDGMNRRDNMVVDKLPHYINRPVGKAVRSRFQGSIGIEEAALVYLCSLCIGHGELDPGLIQIANFRDERVPDHLVLDDDVGLEQITRIHVERNGSKRSRKFSVFADL